MDFLTTITLMEYVLTLLFCIPSAYYFGKILFWCLCKKTDRGLNALMILYIITELTVSLQTLIFALYFLVYW